MTAEAAEEILEGWGIVSSDALLLVLMGPRSDPNKVIDRVNNLAIQQFAKLPRPAVLPSGAENCWFIEMTVEPSRMHESDWTGIMIATLWDESINAPAGKNPVRLSDTSTFWIGETTTEKFNDISSFITLLLTHVFSGSYYCLDQFSKPNDVFLESDFFVTAPHRIIMPDVKVGELVMGFLECFSSVRSENWATNFGAKRRDDPQRRGQTLVACSQYRFIGFQQEGPCPWKKLARCSGCSTAFLWVSAPLFDRCADSLCV